MSASVGTVPVGGDLTRGGITGTLLRFTLPMIAGALLQQCYNIADTLIVGRFVGAGALAAVGSAYTLMVFIVSIMLGLSMGSGTVFSLRRGAGDCDGLRRGVFVAFVLIGAVAVVLNVAALLWLDAILGWLHVPADVYPLMRVYTRVVLYGMMAVFMYNFFASLLRAVGDSFTPLLFLGVSVTLNIGLDLLFILVWERGVSGAAEATVLSQSVAAAGIWIYVRIRRPELLPRRSDMRIRHNDLREIAAFSSLTCVQQSVMNFGILMVQGLVNSFGTATMAAFAAGVKIDSFAYMPVQEFGNAFSTFVAQNFGAGRHGRIRRGIRRAVVLAVAFSIAVSVPVFLFADDLIGIFVPRGEEEITGIGARYLRIEGAFYAGIALLFLLYGYYRAVRMPAMSVVLTVLSLGTRVVLAYWLASLPMGTDGIWWSIPIGWALADAVGIGYYMVLRGRRVSGRAAAMTRNADKC